MNGLGHFSEPLLWFNLYWTFFGVFLILFFAIFFSRGTENSFQNRFKTARKRLMNTSTVIGYFFFIAAIVVGAYLYKNVVYTNNYRTSDERTERQAAYEKQLKKYEFMPQPKITKVNIKADLFPYERDAFFEATVEMVNKTASPIDSIHLQSTQLSSFDLL